MNNVLSLLDEQRAYNSKKSKKHKNLHYIFEITIIAMSCSTAFLLMLNNIPYFIPAISSMLVVVLKSISSIIGFQKHWIICRTITENLKNEKYKFDFGIFEYDHLIEEEKNKLFAQNINKIINNGNDIWLSLMKENEENKK